MRSTSLVLLMMLLGCSSVTEPEDGRVLGAIAGYNNDDPRIDIVTSPGSATVRVMTYGDGCLRKGETEVDLRGAREAVVTPYDYTAARAGTFCTQQLVSFVHEATINFERSGSARIRIRGADHRRRETITVERTVVIP